MKIIVPFIQHVSKNHVRTITDKLEQQLNGDLWVGDKSIELKVEQKFTGNLLVEEFSNREWSTLGWIHTCKADILAYYFLDSDSLYCMSLPALKHWCFGKACPNIDRFRRVQITRDQKNDTHGTIVPIKELRNARLESWYEASPRARLAEIDA